MKEISKAYITGMLVFIICAAIGYYGAMFIDLVLLNGPITPSVKIQRLLPPNQFDSLCKNLNTIRRLK